MSHGTEEHLEHAEHAQHPVHDPFYRQVAMTMAILAAMFFPEKKIRDSLVSRFDPDTPPSVALGLSRGEAAATIVLSRVLTDGAPFTRSDELRSWVAQGLVELA